MARLILPLTNTWLTSSRWGGRICLKCSITKWHNFYDVEYLAGPYDNVEEKRWLLHWWHYFHSRQTHIWKKCKQLEYIYYAKVDHQNYGPESKSYRSIPIIVSFFNSVSKTYFINNYPKRENERWYLTLWKASRGILLLSICIIYV